MTYEMCWNDDTMPIFLWRESLWRIDDRFSPSTRRVDVYCDHDRFNQWTGEIYPPGWLKCDRTAVPITNIFTGEQKIAYQEDLVQYAAAPPLVQEKGEDDAN